MAKSKYSAWKERFGLESIRRLAEDGYSDEEIGIRSGIGVQLFRRWKKQHPEFAAAIELGRSSADYAVVEALYKKAVGYNIALNKTYKLKRIDYDPNTGKKLREYEELAMGIDESFIPGDLRAETFWLKSRQPERWCEKPDKSGVEGDDDAIGVVEIPEADTIDSDE